VEVDSACANSGLIFIVLDLWANVFSVVSGALLKDAPFRILCKSVLLVLIRIVTSGTWRRESRVGRTSAAQLK